MAATDAIYLTAYENHCLDGLILSERHRYRDGAGARAIYGADRVHLQLAWKKVVPALMLGPPYSDTDGVLGGETRWMVLAFVTFHTQTLDETAWDAVTKKKFRAALLERALYYNPCLAGRARVQLMRQARETEKWRVAEWRKVTRRIKAAFKRRQRNEARNVLNLFHTADGRAHRLDVLSHNPRGQCNFALSPDGVIHMNDERH